MVCNTQSECSVDGTGVYDMGNDHIFVFTRKAKMNRKMPDGDFRFA